MNSEPGSTCGGANADNRRESCIQTRITRSVIVVTDDFRFQQEIPSPPVAQRQLAGPPVVQSVHLESSPREASLWGSLCAVDGSLHVRWNRIGDRLVHRSGCMHYLPHFYR